jgi:hypothetical protein
VIKDGGLTGYNSNSAKSLRDLALLRTLCDIRGGMMIKRYTYNNDKYTDCHCKITEFENGEFVYFEHIKHLLERSHNSDYATASPKLPSLEDVIKNKKFTPGMNYIEQINEIYETIRKLGNFA